MRSCHHVLAWQRTAPLFVLVVALGACRIGFDPEGCAHDALFCDDFERTTPLPQPSALWTEADCSEPMARLTVDGDLAIEFPASSTTTLPCRLRSDPTTNSSRYRLAFDLEFDASGGDSGLIIVAELHFRLGAPDAQGIDEEYMQFLLAKDGQANVSVVHHYPDVSRSPNGSPFPGYDLADSNGLPWIVGACRVVLDLDPLAPSAAGTATCGDTVLSLVPRDFAPSIGTRGTPEVALGIQDIDAPASRWNLRFDNFEFSAE